MVFHETKRVPSGILSGYGSRNHVSSSLIDFARLRKDICVRDVPSDVLVVLLGIKFGFTHFAVFSAGLRIT